MTLTLKVGALSITMTVPAHLQSKTSGLLGIFNGNTTDDLTAPDGTVLDTNSTNEVEIYDYFGKLCRSQF